MKCPCSVALSSSSDGVQGLTKYITRMHAVGIPKASNSKRFVGEFPIIPLNVSV
uniref:Uncharacterized protein n=1 Tax=Arundo donax TaxID=35708 RepID=A0A0A9ELT6_ARUDO